jgi:hypothetical protein
MEDGDARISAIVRQVGDAICAVHDEEVSVHVQGGLCSGQAAVRWYKLNATRFFNPAQRDAVLR